MNLSPRAIWLAAVGLMGALAGASAGAAQAPEQPSEHAPEHRPDSLPFACGERLTFRVRTAKFGTVGHAVMAVSGPVDMRGTPTILASFDASAGIAFLKGSDATRSWIDPQRMTSLRFEKRERRPFSSYADSVDIYPDLHHWQGVHGDSGSIASDVPLDELAFIYFLRTLSFAPDSVYLFERHYDSRRIPISVRFVKHEVLTTPAGEFNTVEVEMRAKDSGDYKGGKGVKDDDILRLWFSDDHCRLLVRVESVLPFLGNGVMTLESAVTPACPNLASK